MFGDSPFAEPTSSYNQPVPPVQADPTDNPIVYIPINKQYIPYIAGALQQLLLQAAYPSDISTDDLNLVQSRWMDAISIVGNALSLVLAQFSAGADEGEMMIRQNPDNPCQLQTSIDGTNWCTFADFSKCIPASNQPGPGSPQPAPGGGSECYQIQMAASSYAYLPTTLNSGDVVQIQNPQGSVSSSHNLSWRCEDGGQFFGGLNVGAPFTDPSDPVPTSPSGGIVIVINGSFYFIGEGSFTVPAGVSNAPALFQVNDGNRTLLSGSFQFQACVTNNVASTWTHTFDFTLSPYGFTPWNPGTGPLGVWVAGLGWQGVNYSGTNNECAIIPPVQCNANAITMTAEMSGIPTSPQHQDICKGASLGTVLATRAMGSGENVLSWLGSAALDYYPLNWFDTGAPGLLGYITKAVYSGLGTDPF